MESEKPPEPPKQENPFVSILLNILLPVIILRQGGKHIESPAIVLVVALAFPVVYFIYDFQRRQKKNWISVIGFVSILLTGGVGLLQLPRSWFIVKETAIPALIGLAVLGSIYFKKPVIRMLMFNRELFDLDEIDRRLEIRGSREPMERLLRTSTLFFAGSFFLSAILNFLVASWFIQTEPSVDPVKFNEEVGAMTGWSYLIISVPSMIIFFAILWFLSKGIHRHTGLTMEEALAPHLRKDD